MLAYVTLTSLAVLTLHIVTWNLAEEKTVENKKWVSGICYKTSVVVKELWEIIYTEKKSLVSSTGLCRYSHPPTIAL